MARTYTNTPEPRFVKCAESTKSLIHETFDIEKFTYDDQTKLYSLSINEQEFDRIKDCFMIKFVAANQTTYLFREKDAFNGNKLIAIEFYSTDKTVATVTASSITYQIPDNT